MSLGEKARWELAEGLSLFVHDLRGPMSAAHSIFGYLSNASDGEALEDEATGNVARVSESLYTMAVHLDAIEALGAIELSRRELPKEAREAKATLARVLGREHDYSVELRVPDDLRVYGLDRVMLALRLLMAGASEFASGTRVRVSALGSESQLTLEVRDGGSLGGATDFARMASAKGQLECWKGAPGRYYRGLGLVVAGQLARSVGGEFEGGEEHGQTRITLRVPTARRSRWWRLPWSEVMPASSGSVVASGILNGFDPKADERLLGRLLVRFSRDLQET
ncbi:MAG TPA: hypothetical protein VGA18_02485, partial [Rhodothermales bacterium]